MKQQALSILTLALAVSANAQAPTHAAAEKVILANETAINAAFSKGDSAGMQKHILPDAIAVDPMGGTPVSEMLKMLPQFKIEPGWKIDSSKYLWLDDNTVVHTYRWTGKGTAMGQPVASPSWASTVWVQRGGQWKASFHQETPAVAPPPPPPAKK